MNYLRISDNFSTGKYMDMSLSTLKITSTTLTGVTVNLSNHKIGTFEVTLS
jgi:hypothetical protein